MIMVENVVGDMAVENMRRCTLVPQNQWLGVMDVQDEKGKLLRAIHIDDLTTFDLYL